MFFGFLERMMVFLRRAYTPGEAIGFLLLMGLLLVYVLVSLAVDRLFFFEDDLIRLSQAYYFPTHYKTMIAWGQNTAWPPGGVMMQSAAQLLLPFGLKADVVLANYLWIVVCCGFLHRLGRSAAPGVLSLFPVFLFLTSPITIWLATSALIEPFFLAVFLGETWFLARFFEGMSWKNFAGATGCAFLLTLIRFEGWALGPGMLAAGVLACSWQRRRVAWREMLVAFVALLPPIGWAIGSFVRYGNALEFIVSHTRRLEEYYVIGREEPLLQSLLSSLLEVADVGWVLFLAGLVGFCVLVLRRRREFREPRFLLSALAFVFSCGLFFFMSLRQGWGLFHPRFIHVWYAAGLPLSMSIVSMLWQYRWRDYLLGAAALACLGSLVVADRSRPDLRESYGLRALAAVEERLDDEGAGSLVFLVPEGKLDYAEGAVPAYAPSVEEYSLLKVSDGPEETVAAGDASFVVFRKEYFSSFTAAEGFELLYEDDFYRVLGAQKEHRER